MLELIPQELRELPQWVAAGHDKVPLNPRTGRNASPSVSNTWATFAEAVAFGAPFVGLVLTKNDPYTVIDLDDPYTIKINGIQQPNPDASQVAERIARHSAVFDHFNSYAETSQSGRGVHIIVRGKLPANVQRDKVELYGIDHYVIITGNVLRPATIADYQTSLNGLYAEMASTARADLVELGETMPDARLWEVASTASNSAKFCALWSGDMSGYPSQSEADFALISMLAFYSQSNEQVRRMFRVSSLGQRDKAQRNDKYLNFALSKIRGRQLPLVDLSAFDQKPGPRGTLAPLPQAAALPPLEPEHETPPAPLESLTLPPGLVGEIARYIYASAVRQVPEVALMAALSLVAGVIGRSYHISSTGLNMYLILLAKTGTGKEGAAGGIDALFSAVRQQVPAADEFAGPGTFASGQALTRHLDKSPCFVSVLGEVGLTLQRICDSKASHADLQFRRVLLDLYAKSGPTKVLRPSVYADSEKNTSIVRAPNVTLLGESTPSTFFDALQHSHITEGLIPRFLILQYDGPRVARNPHAFAPPPGELVARLVEMFNVALSTRQQESAYPVATDAAARVLLDAFDVEADHRINSRPNEVEAQLWNRAHLKALKLSALIAAGCSLQQPTITADVAAWAIDFVRRDVEGVAGHFSRGDVGRGDHQKELAVRRAVSDFLGMSQKQRADYRVPTSLLDKQLIPYVFLKRRLKTNKVFVDDMRGANASLLAALDDMVRAGMLQRIPEPQARLELGTSAPVYAMGESY